EIGVGCGAERMLDLSTPGRLLRLRIIAERDAAEQLAGSLARLRRRQRLERAEFDAPGVTTDAVLHNPRSAHATVALAQSKAKAAERFVEIDLVLFVRRQRELGDVLRVQLHGGPRSGGSRGEAPRFRLLPAHACFDNGPC